MTVMNNIPRLTIDTSVFISSFEESDSLHSESLRFFNAINQEESSIVVPVTIVFETFNNLIQRGWTDTSLMRAQFESMDVISLDRFDITRALPIFRQVKLKTADAIVVFVSKEYRAILVSWDKQLIKEATRVVSAMTPTEYLEYEDHPLFKESI